MRPQVRRITTSTACVALAVAGCSLATDDAGPQDTADDVRRALQTGTWAEVDLATGTTAETQREWRRILGGMSPHQPAVALVDVTEKAEMATATMRWTWRFPGRTWAYETTAELDRRGDSWSFALTPDVIEPSLQGDEVLDVDVVRARRGDILGAGDVRLVRERPVERVGIDKTQASGAEAARAARRLAGMLDIDAESFVQQVRGAGDSAFVEGLVLRADEVPTAVRRGLDTIPGGLSVSDRVPLAPTHEFARPVLGSVGPVTAEIIDRSEGRYEVGDEVGLSGLQEQYEERLAGRPGLVVNAVSEDSGRSRSVLTVRPRNGRPLRTSLDAQLQARAERVLTDVEPASAIVAVRPSDGHVLAAASGPGSAGYSTATLGQYAPGSTFKVVSTLALLRSGLTPRSEVACPASVTVDGKRFENYDDYPAADLGRITLQTSVAQSCNTSFIGERGRASQAALSGAAASLGLGVDRDLGYPAFLGSVPARAGSETEHAASMIGQGRVLASPLAMASVAASVASGRAVVPRLVLDHEVEQARPETALTQQESSRLRTMMRAVVGDGSASFLGALPGPEVLAKTGTAEFGTSVPLDTHAWMIGIQGDLAVAVFVELGESGSQTAGPVLEAFLRDG